MLFFEVCDLFKTGFFLAGSALLVREIGLCLGEMIWNDDDGETDS